MPGLKKQDDLHDFFLYLFLTIACVVRKGKRSFYSADRAREDSLSLVGIRCKFTRRVKWDEI